MFGANIINTFTMNNIILLLYMELVSSDFYNKKIQIGLKLYYFYTLKQNLFPS